MKHLTVLGTVGIPDIVFENVSTINIISGKHHWLNLYVLNRINSGYYNYSKKVIVPVEQPIETTYTPFNFNNTTTLVERFVENNTSVFILTYSYRFISYLLDKHSSKVSFYRVEIVDNKPEVKYYDNEALDGAFHIMIEIRF